MLLTLIRQQVLVIPSPILGSVLPPPFPVFPVDLPCSSVYPQARSLQAPCPLKDQRARSPLPVFIPFCTLALSDPTCTVASGKRVLNPPNPPLQSAFLLFRRSSRALRQIIELAQTIDVHLLFQESPSKSTPFLPYFNGLPGRE